MWFHKHPPEFTLTNVFDGYASAEIVANFSCSPDGHSYYGQRLRAFLLPEQTGLFLFQLSCSFQCQLWISTDDDEVNKVKILSIDHNGNPEPVLRLVEGQRS